VSDSIALHRVRHVERIEMKRFCLMVATSSQTWYLLFRDAVSLHDWLYDIRIRCPLLRIGVPTDFRHEMHVTYDSVAGEITVGFVPSYDTAHGAKSNYRDYRNLGLKRFPRGVWGHASTTLTCRNRQALRPL
jgi:hypothetical protein